MTTPPALLATAAAQGAVRHSEKVTDWSDRIGWVVGLLLVVALIGWLMRQGWQWRRTLQGDLPALPQPPRDLGPALLSFEGLYHGSTTAGHWLDRIVAHGLGVQSKARVTLTAAGLDVERTGAPRFFVPLAALRGARLDRAIAGKVMPEGGLLVVTWEHGGALIDSGFRAGHSAEHPQWVRGITDLAGGPAAAENPATAAGTPAQADAGAPAPRGGSAAAAPHDLEHHPQHDKEGAQ